MMGCLWGICKAMVLGILSAFCLLGLGIMLDLDLPWYIYLAGGMLIGIWAKD